MNQDILLSKIVPNSTDTTWAQAYTTLNVYITLSIEAVESKTPVTIYGKELLEKLQREFFALDDKSLDNIKDAVGNVSKTIGDDYTYSIIVGAIVKDVLYIVIASAGQVSIKRGERTGVIATGIEKELHGFSGKLKHDDIIILQTGDFAKKIPLSNLSENLNSTDVTQIAENITPLIHESSKGTESAIIIQFKDIATPGKLDQNDFEPSEQDESSHQPTAEEPAVTENLWTKPPHENRNIEELVDDKPSEAQKPNNQKSRFSFIPALPHINFANRNVLIVTAVVLLAMILIGGIGIQTSRQNAQKREAEFATEYAPVKQKFDEGSKLASLNQTLALEDLEKALDMVNSVLAKYEEGSSEHEKLAALKTQIEKKISSLEGGEGAQNSKEFLKPGGDIKSITSITARAGELIVLDSQGEQVIRVDKDGKPGKVYDIEDKGTFIASDDNFIFVMGESVTRIDKGNGAVTKVLDEAKGEAFDIFGSNFYILDGKDILKYRAPSETSSSYFTEEPGFESTPTHISISGSIWVIENSGTISRFTKGKKDDFELTGLEAPFGSGAIIYADPDSSNIYVMDVKNQRVVGISDEGSFVKQYEGSFIKNATSFAIDEVNKVGYVVSNNTITSFDL